MAFIIIILMVFTVFTFMNINNTNIINGISIKGIDVSGLSKEQAKEKITNYINQSIPEEIKLTHNDYETSISSSDLEIFFNLNDAVNKAYSIGRGNNFLKNNIEVAQTYFNNINIEPVLKINEDVAKEKLDDISTKLPDKVIESSYYIDGNNLIITKGSNGAVVDSKKTIASIKKNINDLNVNDNAIELITNEQSPNEIDLDSIYQEIKKDPVDASYTTNPFSVVPSENGVDFAISLDDAKAKLNEDKDEYSIPLKVIYPSVTTNMIGAEAFPDLLSQFSTNYPASNKNRTTNLILASNKINGTVLMPGETFSYNKVVGARTIEAGYKEAPIYVEGRVENGLGGGICQIASTLYNAVLYSNLEIVSRSNHQFVPSYVPASRDATVVYGAIDFQFKNNRNYPIKITCSVANGIANFKIWGLKTDDDYDVEITNRVTKTTSNAIYSEAYKTLKKDGAIVSTTRISSDTYKRH